MYEVLSTFQLFLFKMFGHISGAHVNPVISMAALILNEITVAQIPIYIFSQMSGCLVGYGFHKVMLQIIYLQSYINEKNRVSFFLNGLGNTVCLAKVHIIPIRRNHYFIYAVIHKYRNIMYLTNGKECCYVATSTAIISGLLDAPGRHEMRKEEVVCRRGQGVLVIRLSVKMIISIQINSKINKLETNTIYRRKPQTPEHEYDEV